MDISFYGDHINDLNLINYNDEGMLKQFLMLFNICKSLETIGTPFYLLFGKIQGNL